MIYNYLAQNHSLHVKYKEVGNKMVDAILESLPEYFDSLPHSEKLDFMQLCRKARIEHTHLTDYYLKELFVKRDPLLLTKKGSWLNDFYAPNQSKVMHAELVAHPEFYIKLKPFFNVYLRIAKKGAFWVTSDQRNEITKLLLAQIATEL